MKHSSIYIKKGDAIIVRVGKSRGKRGTVARVLPSRGMLVVSGVNVYKKHIRPKRQGEKGQLVELPRPLRIANVALFCARCNRGVRVGSRIDSGKKTRFCRLCSQAI
jgi:large subunit ribosomal protein L24